MELQEKLHRALKILEDATTASLAPFPVPTIGSVVTVTKRKDIKNAEEKKHSNKPV